MINIIKKYKLLIISIVVIFLILIVSFLLLKNNNTKPKVSTSFFVKNKDNLYALFNQEGKQLTDFLYTSVEDFYNGVAKVKDKDNKSGVINDTGKYIMPLGKYDYILQYSSLFKIKENDKSSLLNINGKKIIAKKDFEIENSNVNNFILINTKDSYIIYNYNGKKIYTFKIKDNENVPKIYEYGEYGSVYYDNLSLIFNSYTGKIISKVKSSEAYSINAISENKKTIILSTSTSWLDKDTDIKYKAIVNNKLKDLSNICDSLSINTNNLICTKDNASYLLNKKLKITDVNLNKVAYKDYKNYITMEDNNVLFVNNNKVINKIDNAIISDRGYSQKGIYLLYKDDEFNYYDSKGNKLFDKGFVKALMYDENDLAKVSDDGKNFYFINVDGKKVSQEFSTAYLTKDYYILGYDNKKGLIKKDGTMLVPIEYEELEIKSNNNANYALVKIDASYELIDLQNTKNKLKFNQIPTFYDSYYKVIDNDITIYYSYTGKKLFEE